MTATQQAVLCFHKGVCRPEESCRRFVYDPLRRRPKQEPVLRSYSKEDFEL